jgi:3-deoxy-manno-octulosonate cytidylyltransferase (CMP-KDO synthetase)
MIAGLPMIEHVRRRALLAEGVAEVVVATCDRAIFDVVTQAGGRAVMTADTHERSSERVAEAMESLEGDVVVVAQGDEPTLVPDTLTLVASPFHADPTVQAVSLLSPLESEADFHNPNVVKAARDLAGRVIYYSRAPIPYFMKPGAAPVFRETGIRAFTAQALQEYVRLPETPLEKVESVDMFRLLEHGRTIHSVVTSETTLGVDHPEDVALAEAVLARDPVQRRLHERIGGRFS